jgi:hypothetical protein
VTAVLRRDVKKSGVILVPKAARLHGRITILRHQNGGGGYFIVGFEFFEVEYPGAKGPIRAELEQVLSAGSNISGPGAPRFGSNGRFAPVVQSAQLSLPGSVFFIRGESFKLARGLHMFWRTQPPLRTN